MYEAMLRRQAKEQMERRRDFMLAALWGNSNYDHAQEIRPQLSEKIDDLYTGAISRLYGGKGTPAKPAEEQYPDHPFFAAYRGEGATRPVTEADMHKPEQHEQIEELDIDQPTEGLNFRRFFPEDAAPPEAPSDAPATIPGWGEATPDALPDWLAIDKEEDD